MSEGVTPSQGSGQHRDSHAETNTFFGGVVVAIFALLLFAMTFAVAGATTIRLPSGPGVLDFVYQSIALIFNPRIMSIALGAVGVVTAFGLMPVRGPQDYYGGLVLVMLGTLALIASADLPGQRGFAFGPGTAPRLFAGILCALGIAVTVVGVVNSGPHIEKYKLRGPLWVLVAICTFAAIVRPFGLVVASFQAFLISIFGSTEMRWIESNTAAALMTLFCVALFVHLLNLPFQLWPQPNAHIAVVQEVGEFLKLIFGPLLKAVGLM